MLIPRFTFSSGEIISRNSHHPLQGRGVGVGEEKQKARLISSTKIPWVSKEVVPPKASALSISPKE